MKWLAVDDGRIDSYAGARDRVARDRSPVLGAVSAARVMAIS
jgi:hypothetical protein